MGARIEMLSAHSLHLGVKGFNAFAVEQQVIIVSPSVGGHVFATSGDQTDIDSLEDRGGIGSGDIAFVTEEACAVR